MTHWKSMMDRDYIFAFDLQGKNVNVTIDKITAGELHDPRNPKKKAKKPVCYFVGKEKPLALNSVNCKTIAAMYGNDTENWRGKAITLYPTTCEAFGETVECIRVRPERPTAKAAAPEPSDNDGVIIQ
jgi:hypothetical protein